MTTEKENNKRRDFLKSCLRSFLLGTIAFITGVVGWRRNPSQESGRCFIETPCGNCGKLLFCADPRAIGSRKENRSGKQNG